MTTAMEQLKAYLEAGVVFDWHLAADLLRGWCPDVAYVCDYEAEKVVIWKDGHPMIPEGFSFANQRGFELQIGDGDSHGDCPLYNCECAQSKHPEWNEDTVWPESARQLLLKKV